MSGEVSGSNSRVVDVMNFLAAHPTEAFTLSEIASQLGLSNGTAHRVLTTLAESRYLSRHPKHKTYSLGMALVAIGQAALVKHRNVDVARRHLARLADDLNVQCIASTVVDDELLILACEGIPQSSEPHNQIGERRPFIPPLGMWHVAWCSENAQREYLDRAPAALSERVRQRFSAALALIKERGYGMAGSGPAMRALRQLTSQPVGHQENESYWAGLRQLLADLTEKEAQLLDLDEVGPEGISYITAPVFSSTGDVVLELSLSGLPSNLARRDMERYVERLCATAAQVTRETHGRPPQDLGGSGAKAKPTPVAQ